TMQCVGVTLVPSSTTQVTIPFTHFAPRTILTLGIASPRALLTGHSLIAVPSIVNLRIAAPIVFAVPIGTHVLPPVLTTPVSALLALVVPIVIVIATSVGPAILLGRILFLTTTPVAFVTLIISRHYIFLLCGILGFRADGACPLP